MAFEILSINKIEREYDYQPNYEVSVRYKQANIRCEVCTNAFMRKIGNGLLILDNITYGRVNGNLYFKLEVLDSWHGEYEKDLEREIRRYARNQNN